MNETEVDFSWNGEEYSAYGTPYIETTEEDIGPCRWGEHFMSETVNSVEMSDIEILKDGQLVVDPPKDLFDKADGLLCLKAGDDWERSN